MQRVNQRVRERNQKGQEKVQGLKTFPFLDSAVLKIDGENIRGWVFIKLKI
jgi:hypothetical protein